ncbi:hypothetical protein EDD21DRAFT_391407 [Dissophora ornata]|nr:hypothetical protein EDD21DRAFT_391407 [Dissophora ornata]
MCRPQELKERRERDVKKDGAGNKEGCSGDAKEGLTNSCRRGNEGRDEGCTTTMMGECVFHGWMYRPEEYVHEHMATSSTSGSSNDSSANASICGLSDTTSATAAPSSSSPEPHLASSSACVSRTILETEDEESSQYSISKHDADLDELDQYLIQRGATVSAKSATMTGKGATVLSDNETINYTKALDRDTCNDRFYWDLWGRDDPVLQNISFSRRRARMLWRHVANLEER